MLLNRNTKCYYQGDPNGSANLEELFGHEFGHALGLAHTCETVEAEDGTQTTPDCKKKKESLAMMFPFLRGDGLGVMLNAEDKTGFRKGLKY